MRLLLVVAIAVSCASAQQVTRTQSFDVNGHPIRGVAAVETRSINGASRAQVTRDVNGRSVPVESVEERVVSESGPTKVVERIVRRYDANGRPGPPERTVIESTTQGDGSVRSTATVHRTDLNGNSRIEERTTAVTRKRGDGSETSTIVERLGSTGTLQVAERQEESLRTTRPGASTRTATVERPDLNGRFTEVYRQTAERTESSGAATENAAEYEAAGTGQMRLIRQSVSRTESGPSGNRTEVDVFEPNSPGVAAGSSASLQLSRQQVLEMKFTPTGSVETRGVREVLPSGGGRLGPLRTGEQVICTGECGKKPAAPAIIK